MAAEIVKIETKPTKKLLCDICGSEVSTPVPESTTLKAKIVCDICLSLVNDYTRSEFFRQASWPHDQED